jgi:hypothetical protein
MRLDMHLCVCMRAGVRACVRSGRRAGWRAGRRAYFAQFVVEY